MAAAPRGRARIAYLSYRGKPHVGGQAYTRHQPRPHPVLDPRVPLVKLPSLDIFNDTCRPFRRTEGDQALAGPGRDIAQHRPAGSASHWPSASERGATSTAASSSSTSSTASASWPSTASCVLETLRRPKKDRALEVAQHADEASISQRWYGFVKMQGPPSPVRLPMWSLGVRELDRRHPYQLRGAPREHAPRPVGTNPGSSRCPMSNASPEPLMHRPATPDIALKGLSSCSRRSRSSAPTAMSRSR